MVITKQVMLMKDFGDSVFYKVDCGCGCDDGMLTIELEYEDDMFFMNFYKKIAWNAEWKTKWFGQRIWKRIKVAFKVLFTGYFELEESFIFDDEEHVNNFILAIAEGRVRLENSRRLREIKLKEMKNGENRN